MSLSFTKYYFDAFNKHVEEYGTKTAVFIQCGSFFEVYGMKDEYRNVYGSNISEVAKICDLNIVDKFNGMKNNDTLVMIGFQIQYLNKYAKKLQDHNYTVIFYKQSKVDGTIVRNVAHIFYPSS